MLIFITTQERRIYHAEVGLIRKELRTPHKLTRLSARINPLDFADYRHQLIWAALLRLKERGAIVSPECVLAELASRAQDDDAGGLNYLNYLARK